jgi:tRNA threonylcarbamoyladenosine biosynthesis protein TsaB
MPEVVVCRIRTVDDALVARAAMVARLAEQDFRNGIAVPAEQAQPVYIRDEVAWKKLPGRA